MRNRWIIALMLLGGLVSANSSGQNVDAKIVSVGYPFSSVFTHTVRESQWFPILVEIQTSEPQITLELKVRCEDLDGDTILYTREPITITPQDGLRQVWCYAITHQRFGAFGTSDLLPRYVDVFAEGAGRIAQLEVPGFEMAGDIDSLVLDISNKAVSHLTRLNSVSDLQDPAFGARKHYRKIYIARAPALTTIPDQWFGLEPIDTVVWDLADPRSGQIGKNQLTALLEWVKRGGHLIVGIGENEGFIRDSELVDYLPVTLTGGSRMVSEFPRFDTANVMAELRGSLDTPVAVANNKMRDGAIQIMWDEMDGSPMPLIAMQGVGSGRVTAVTAPMSALFRAGTEERALAQLIDFNTNTTKYNENETQSLAFSMQIPPEIAPEVLSAVSFARAGGLLALLATFFVASYITLSTLVSWVWLKRFNRQSLSWPLFGIFAIAASLLSLGTVRVSRGLTSSVQQISLVDFASGESEAYSACWIGYRSPNRETPTFTLPTVIGDRQITSNNYLRPMAPLDGSQYATPSAYSSQVTMAELSGVLVRSTAKQFEGHWSGMLDGTIRARLIVDRRSGEFTPASFIVNELPHDVRVGAILYIDPRLSGQVPVKAAGLTRSHRPEFTEGVPPAANVVVVPIGQIESGSELRGSIGASHFDAIRQTRARDQQRRPEDPKRWADLTTLRELQRGAWRNRGWSMASSGLANLSFNHIELPGGAFADFDTAGPRRRTRGLVDYDITHWLIRGQAVLLVVVDDPGPAVLHRDGRPRVADQGETLYRVRVPLEYVGQPIRGVRP